MEWIVIAVPVAAGLAWLAVGILRYNLERRTVRSLADAMPPKQRERIFALVEAIGTSPSKGYIGVMRDAPEPSGRLRLRLPDGLADFPWGGMAVDVLAADREAPSPVEFSLSSQTVAAQSSDEQPIRWVAVPFITAGENERGQSVFSIDRYVRLSRALAGELNELYAKNPQALLAQLLSADGRLSAAEPFDQLRCGVSAAWIQSPRFHKCPTCRRPMRLIIQVPGALLGRRLAEGSFYHFGCPTHPDQSITEADWG